MRLRKLSVLSEAVTVSNKPTDGGKGRECFGCESNESVNV
jgi:hypothetical protein